MTLEKVIDLNYLDFDTDNLPGISKSYEYFVWDMFQITLIKNGKMELMHLFKDEIFYPVLIPDNLIPFLNKGQVFLMIIALKRKQWTTLYMSPPYS